MSFPISGQPSYELAASLLDEACRISATAISGGVSMDPLSNCVFSMVVRGIRLAHGAKTLIEKRLQGESMILGRSLFEDSIKVAEMSYNPNRCRGLMMRWHLDSMNEVEGLYKSIPTCGLSADKWKSVPPTIASQRLALADIARKEGISPKNFNLKGSALLYGRQHDYWTYLWAHEMTHGSDVAHAIYRSVDPTVGDKPQNVYLATDKDAPDMAMASANWCARSLLQTAGCAAWIFGRDPMEADEAFSRSNQLENYIYELQGHGPASIQAPPPPRK